MLQLQEGSSKAAAFCSSPHFSCLPYSLLSIPAAGVWWWGKWKVGWKTWLRKQRQGRALVGQWGWQAAGWETSLFSFPVQRMAAWRGQHGACLGQFSLLSVFSGRCREEHTPRPGASLQPSWGPSLWQSEPMAKGQLSRGSQYELKGSMSEWGWGVGGEIIKVKRI